MSTVVHARSNSNVNLLDADGGASGIGAAGGAGSGGVAGGVAGGVSTSAVVSCSSADGSVNGGNGGGGMPGGAADCPPSPTSDVEQRVRHAADKQCWSTFVTVATLALVLLVVLIWSQWSQTGGAVQTNSVEYFVLCMIGGVLSGLPHFLLTPFDQIKCRMQTGEFASAVDGFKHIWFTATLGENGSSSSASAVAGGGAASSSSTTSPSSLLENGKEAPVCGSLALLQARISALYRGWAATLIGYSLQGAAKFGLYEYFKWALRGFVGHEFARNHAVLLFLVASACAELCADVLLAPWEAVKVKIQTNAALTPVMSAVVPRMFSLEGFHGFFKGLPPLWMRQVPYTMAKFATFEKTVELLYAYVLRAPKSAVAPSTQLFVSLAAGFCAGMFCTVVSHPADTVVSKLNQKADARVGSWQIMQELGCSGLWKGVFTRIVFIGTLTALQWLIYDSFKVMVGLQTTGGSASSSSPGGAGAPGSIVGGSRQIHAYHRRNH